MVTTKSWVGRGNPVGNSYSGSFKTTYSPVVCICPFSLAVCTVLSESLQVAHHLSNTTSVGHY